MVSEIKCIVADHSIDGYRMLSETECNSLDEFGFYESGILNYKPPYGVKEWTLYYDNKFRVEDLYKEVFQQFGITKLSEISDFDKNEVLVGTDIVLILDDVTFIRFDSYKTLLDEIVTGFNLTSIKLYIVPGFGRGEILNGKVRGFKIYIPSHEGNRHNTPHIHVEGPDNRSCTLDIFNLNPLSNNCSLRDYEIRRARKQIEPYKQELLELWNLQCDGISIEKYLFES